MYGREDAIFEAMLDRERRKKRSGQRAEACLATSLLHVDHSTATYPGGAGWFWLMLNGSEINQRVRVMELLHQQQMMAKKQQSNAAARRANQTGSQAVAAAVRAGSLAALAVGQGSIAGGGITPTPDIEQAESVEEDIPLGPQLPKDLLPLLDLTTLKKYRRQFRLDMPLQAPKDELARVVVSHFLEHKVPSEQVTLNKFVESVRKRRETGGTTMINTLETKKAMQRALREEEEEEEEEEEDDEEVFTIEQDNVTIEFTIGAKVQVLYDDNEWYPGEICAYTETTGKFRFKLTEGSNTRFAEWLPNPDIKVVGADQIGLGSARPIPPPLHWGCSEQRFTTRS